MFSYEAFLYLNIEVNRYKTQYECHINPHWLGKNHVQCNPRDLERETMFGDTLIGLSFVFPPLL